MFAKIDEDQDGLISVQDLIGYMKSKYLKISKEDAEMIIHEYDADGDSSLNFDEYAMFALPSTNSSLREVALLRSKAYYYSSQRQLSFEAEQIQTSLIEQELKLVKKREFLKAELLKREDFIKAKAFNEIGQGKETITLQALVQFLQKNDFSPRREDLEAILRRCDHSANQELTLEEFSESVSCNQYNFTQEQIEENNYRSKSVERKELQDSARKLKRSNSRKDHFEESIEDTFEKYNSPPKDEKKLQEKEGKNVARKLDMDENIGAQDKIEEQQNEEGSEQENQEKDGQEEAEEDQEQEESEVPLKFRYHEFLKAQLKLDKEIEIHKEALFQNEFFNTIDAFKLFDTNNDGYITIGKMYEKSVELNLMPQLQQEDKLSLLFARFDRDLDGKLNYLEFTKAITPKNTGGVTNYYRSRYAKISPEDAEYKRREWIEDLARVLESCITIEDILRVHRKNNNLDGNTIFKMLDHYNLGYISSRVLKNWLSEECGCKLSDDDVTLFMSRHDKDGDYRIGKDEFLSEVLAEEDGEEEDQQEGIREEPEEYQEQIESQ